MAMIVRVLRAALLAGFIAGVIVSIAQAWQTQPLMGSAELLEAVDSVQAVADDQETEVWSPTDGLERWIWTSASNVLIGVGYACVLAAAMTLSGRSVTAREGVLWGLAGFAVFSVAPALGMPPVLPGMATAPLQDRQIWWIGTAMVTAAGLWLVVLVQVRWITGLGVLLLALPHLVGAPAFVLGHKDTLPPQLAAQFAVATLFVSALFWTALGATLGQLLRPRATF